MGKEIIEVVGRITEALPNTMFRVEVEEGPQELKGEVILCHLSGRMRMHYIKILPGDRVKVEMSAYDPTKGRIVYREKG